MPLAGSPPSKQVSSLEVLMKQVNSPDLTPLVGSPLPEQCWMMLLMDLQACGTMTETTRGGPPSLVRLLLLHAKRITLVVLDSKFRVVLTQGVHHSGHEFLNKTY